MPRTTYAIGLGSNRRGRHGAPVAEIGAALAAIGSGPARLVTVSPVIASLPLGPSIRRFANAAALIETDEDPPALLARLKAIERDLGRRRGRRWGARVIDLDILLWSGGRWRTRTLAIPHEALADRPFVLRPLLAIVPGWRVRPAGRTIRQLAHAVDRRRPRS